MKIAIDWDKTWTADPALFAEIASAMQARGHDVFIVTMRYENEAIDAPIPVYYTCRHGKRAFMEGLGISVDVWVDDKPHFIGWGPSD